MRPFCTVNSTLNSRTFADFGRDPSARSTQSGHPNPTATTSTVTEPVPTSGRKKRRRKRRGRREPTDPVSGTTAVTPTPQGKSMENGDKKQRRQEVEERKIMKTEKNTKAGEVQRPQRPLPTQELLKPTSEPDMPPKPALPPQSLSATAFRPGCRPGNAYCRRCLRFFLPGEGSFCSNCALPRGEPCPDPSWLFSLKALEQRKRKWGGG